MLLSHKYQFIFIKTTKTAGTSLEVELSKSMDKGDVVTPIKPEEDGHAPRNYKRLFGLKTAYNNHMPATAIRKRLGKARFDDYYKFSIEREPVSKCISQFSMRKNSPLHNKDNKDLTWDRYVELGHFPHDHQKYTDEDGSLLVDRLIKYETLEDDLREICEMLGMSFSGITSRAKSGFRETPDVSDTQRERIYDAFAPSLKFTGYSL